MTGSHCFCGRVAAWGLRVHHADDGCELVAVCGIHKPIYLARYGNDSTLEIARLVAA